MEKENKGLSLISNNTAQNNGGRFYSGSRVNRSDFSKYIINTKQSSRSNISVNKTDNQPEQNENIEALKTLSIDMNLPGGESINHGSIKIKNPIKEKLSGWTFRLASVVVVIVMFLGGGLLTISYLNVNKVLRGGAKTAAAIQASVDPSLLGSEGDGRVNVLLMGRGGGTHDAPDLTDTMMLASIDPVDKTMVLVSIPRDLWVDVPGHGAMKINAAWETGEFAAEGKVAPGSTDPKVISAANQEVDQVVEQVLGVNVNYNIVVNFHAFQQAVDSIGGVNVDVPTQLYDPTMAWENHNNPVLAQAGLQNFDGAKALRYVRSRETTSDFARSQRQRAVLLAIKQKVESLGILTNPLKMADLASSFGNNVTTDISMSDAAKIYKIVSKISENNVSSIGLADSPNKFIITSSISGQSIDIPKEGMFKYTDIHNFMQSLLPDPYIKKENAKIYVLNGTGDASLMAAKIAKLKALGYNVVGSGNTTNTNYASSIIIKNNSNNPYTLHYLEQRLSATVLNSLSDSSMTQTKGADFVIIIGNDETISNQN